MIKVIAGVIILLHGLVHGWFVILAAGYVNYKSNMGWTQESWILSEILEPVALKKLAIILFSTCGILFVAAALGISAESLWKMNSLVVAAVFSSISIILFFDGNWQMLVQKGLVGLIINGFIIFQNVFLK